MKITLQDATLSLSATDAGERANIGALFQVLSSHQGKFSVNIGARVFPLNQKADDVADSLEPVAIAAEVPASVAPEPVAFTVDENAHTAFRTEPTAVFAVTTPASEVALDAHDEHLLSVAEGEGMIASEPTK